MHLMIRRALLVLVLAALPGIQTAFGEPATAAPSPQIEQRALGLLKAVTAKLGGAKTFSFRTRSAPAGTPGADGPFASFFADARFAVMRPDKVRAKVRGEAPPLDVFFDGRTLTVYQPTLNLYATTDEPGMLEALIPFALQRAGVLFPLADVLAGDPQTAIRRITRARHKGVAVVAGRQCEHAAFAAPGVEWEIWVDARNSLPCRLAGRLLEMQGAPRFALDFFDWKLNPPLAAGSFAFAKPAGAGQLDFRALMGQ